MGTVQVCMTRECYPIIYRMHVPLQLEYIPIQFFYKTRSIQNDSWRALIEVFLIFDQFVFAVSNRESIVLSSS